MLKKNDTEYYKRKKNGVEYDKRKENGVKYYKKKAPATSANQERRLRQQTHLRKLSHNFLPQTSSKMIVVNDKSYFVLKGKQMPSNSGIYFPD